MSNYSAKLLSPNAHIFEALTESLAGRQRRCLHKNRGLQTIVPFLGLLVRAVSALGRSACALANNQFDELTSHNLTVADEIEPSYNAPVGTIRAM